MARLQFDPKVRQLLESVAEQFERLADKEKASDGDTGSASITAAIGGD
jgi:hypothetical protein